MIKVEPSSFAVPLLRFLCAMSKDRAGQTHCKYYQYVIHLDKPRECTFLGNWTEGFRMCESEQAKLGHFEYLRTLQPGG